MDNKWIILIVIIFVGIIGYMYMTTPYLEVDNFIVEKHTETINYVSGKIDKNKIITSNFTIIKSHANRLGVKGNFIFYDKYGNVIYNFTFEQSDAPYEFSYYWDYLEDADKVKTVELIIYNIENGVVLYHNNTTNIQKGIDTSDEIDDTPEPTPTHHRELTEREIIEMDAEAYGQAEVGEYYLGHDENGNLKRYKKHHPIFG